MDRRASLATGLLYLLTFVTSIPALALKAPAIADLSVDGAATSLRVAGALEILLAFTCVGTAVAIYPVARRHSETAAIGFVASRTVEAGLVLLGVAAMLALLRQPNGALAALHDWAFLLGPGLMPAVNALLLGSVLYRSRLVPRAIPIMGFVGGPLLALSATGSLFGVVDQVSAWAALLALPIAAWELSLGLWLTVKGFRTLRA